MHRKILSRHWIGLPCFSVAVTVCNRLWLKEGNCCGSLGKTHDGGGGSKR